MLPTFCHLYDIMNTYATGFMQTPTGKILTFYHAIVSLLGLSYSEQFKEGDEETEDLLVGWLLNVPATC